MSEDVQLSYLGSVLTAGRGRPATVTAMLPSGPAYPRPHVSILKTQTGHNHTELLVLKRYRNAGVLQDERRALQSAHESGTPAPAVVAAETSGDTPVGSPFLLMTHVDGRHLDEIPKDDAAPVLDSLIDIVTQLHVAHRRPSSDLYKQSAWTLQLLPERLEEHREVAVPYLREYSTEAATQTHELTQSLSTWLRSQPDLLDRFTPTFLHGDLHPSNIRVGADGQIGLIDWGESCWGDPAVEFAYFYVRTLWLCFPALADEALGKLVAGRLAALEDETLSSRLEYYAAATMIVTLRRCGDWQRPDLAQRLAPLLQRMAARRPAHC